MSDIDGFILAGGKSSRMGKDKAGLLLDGKTFVERAALALSTVAENLFVVGKGSENSHGMPVLLDDFHGKENISRHGAIIGLQTALKNTIAAWAAILACDLPFASGELFVDLALFRDDKVDAVVPVEKDGRPQPLHAIYRPARCLTVVDTMIRGNDWSLKNLLSCIRTRYVGFDQIKDIPNSEFLFLNVNNPEDYAESKLILARTR
jgi:molybdopterin-guanine dinucleotide biosynthesis protein A/molybdopterin-guanine dinucleotide biosynthesis protein